LTTGFPVIQPSSLVQDHSIAADNINAGPPVIGSPTVSEVTGAIALPITTGQPTLGPSSITQTHNIDADGVVSQEPTISLSVITQAHQLTLVAVVTGSPVVGIGYLNAAQGRAVHVSNRSYNTVTTVNSINFCVLTSNTPNKVIVENANEAA